MKLAAANTWWAQNFLIVYTYTTIFISLYTAILHSRSLSSTMHCFNVLDCILDLFPACFLSALWFSAYSSEAGPVCLDLNCLSDVGSVLPSLPALLLNRIVYPTTVFWIIYQTIIFLVRFKSWISLCKFTQSVIIVSTLCVIPCFYCTALSPLNGPVGKTGPSKGTTPTPHFSRGSRLVRVWDFHNNLVGKQLCRVTMHYSVVLLKHVKL